MTTRYLLYTTFRRTKSTCRKILTFIEHPVTLALACTELNYESSAIGCCTILQQLTSEAPSVASASAIALDHLIGRIRCTAWKCLFRLQTTTRQQPTTRQPRVGVHYALSTSANMYYADRKLCGKDKQVVPESEFLTTYFRSTCVSLELMSAAIILPHIRRCQCHSICILKATILDLTLLVFVHYPHNSHWITRTYSRWNYLLIISTIWDMCVSGSATATLDFPVKVASFRFPTYFRFDGKWLGSSTLVLTVIIPPFPFNDLTSKAWVKPVLNN